MARASISTATDVRLELTDDCIEKVVSELMTMEVGNQALNYVFDKDPAKRRQQFKMSLALASQPDCSAVPRGDCSPAEGLGWRGYVELVGNALMRVGVSSFAREHVFGALQRMEGLVEVAEEAPLDDQRIAFATLKPTMQDSASTMMTQVKGTLQQATEITAKVDEAERVAEEANKFAANIRETHAHIERQRASRKHLYRFRQTARDSERLGEELADSPAPIAASLTKEIQLSVLWTQQLLELVNLAESAEPIAPGARLHPQAAQAGVRA